MNPFDQVKSTFPSAVEEEGDLIELVEVMEEDEPLELTDEAADEVVLDFRGGSDLAALKPEASLQEEKPPAPPAVPKEESLDDFLATLPELPEDLDIPDATLRGVAAPDLPRELAGRLNEEELQELVRQVVQDTVTRLAQEMVPSLAAEAIERELARLKKRLVEPD